MRRKKLLRIALVAASALVAFALACNVAVVRGGDPRPRHLAEADVIVVLGAGIASDGTPSQVLHDRLETALELYREGRAPRILLTGDHAAKDYDEVASMRRFLLARGVPEEALVLDGAGVDTFSSIARARTVYGAEKAIVVTQGFHLPRAVWLARSMGIDAEGAVADKRTYRGALWFEVREVFSRTKAWLDVGVGRKPVRLDPVA